MSLWKPMTNCIAVKFAKPWMSSHFSELRDRMVGPCVQDVPQKIGKASPAGYTHQKEAKRSTKGQVMWLHVQSGLVPSRWGASRIIKYCCWLWHISRPSMVSSLQHSPEEKRIRQWRNELLGVQMIFTCKSFYSYTHVLYI